MDTLRVPDDFREFLRLLNSKGVEYLVVGGWAVNYYGYSRPTGDIDLWVAAHPRNAAAIVEALREFGFGVGRLRPGLFLKPDQIVRLGRPPLRIELLTTISGVSFEECYRARASFMDGDMALPFISLRDLRRNKKASGRLKDLADLDELRPRPRQCRNQ